MKPLLISSVMLPDLDCPLVSARLAEMMRVFGHFDPLKKSALLGGVDECTYGLNELHPAEALLLRLLGLAYCILVASADGKVRHGFVSTSLGTRRECHPFIEGVNIFSVGK